jgi:hypothetical protein
MVLIHSFQCLERNRSGWENKREEEMRGEASEKMIGEEMRLQPVRKYESRGGDCGSDSLVPVPEASERGRDERRVSGEASEMMR